MPAEFVVGSVVATILVLVPLPTQLRDRNFATLSLLAWLFLVNVYRGIDAIVWLDDAVVRGPVWCDIGKFSPAYVVESYLFSRPKSLN